MLRPLLTIGILTYYKDHDLQRTLGILSAQLSNPEVYAQVEVIVSDDAGPGDAREVVAEYQRKFPKIRFNRNAQNLGFDRNIETVFSLARGLYCWIMSDDDAMRDGALEFILSALHEHPEAAYICIAQNESQERGDSAVFPNGESLLKEVGMAGGLVSQNVFLLDALPPDREKYYGNLWFHYSLALEMGAKRPVILVKNILMPPPSGQKPRWVSGGKQFYSFTSLKKIISNLPQFGYDQVFIGKLTGVMVGDLPRTVASARLHGLPVTLRNIALLFKEYGEYPLVLAQALVISIAPRFILKGIQKINKKRETVKNGR